MKATISNRGVKLKLERLKCLSDVNATNIVITSILLKRYLIRRDFSKSLFRIAPESLHVQGVACVQQSLISLSVSYLNMYIIHDEGYLLRRLGSHAFIKPVTLDRNS